VSEKHQFEFHKKTRSHLTTWNFFSIFQTETCKFLETQMSTCTSWKFCRNISTFLDTFFHQKSIWWILTTKWDAKVLFSPVKRASWALHSADVKFRYSFLESMAILKALLTAVWRLHKDCLKWTIWTERSNNLRKNDKNHLVPPKSEWERSIWMFTKKNMVAFDNLELFSISQTATWNFFWKHEYQLVPPENFVETCQPSWKHFFKQSI
jgi:hypothetical protein